MPYLRLNLSRCAQALALLSTFFLCPTAKAQYPTDVDYKKRGDRFEGVKARPVGGYYIELISALALTREAAPQMPEKLRIRFFLEEKVPAYITVRERDPRHNYWLDKVTPREPWGLGFNNEFEWPTSDVIRKLEPHIKRDDLAVLVRLTRDSPTLSERVAPAIFYSASPPKTISGYAFTFKLGVNSRLKCSIFKKNSSTPVYTQNFPREYEGRPFTFVWNDAAAPEGLYRLTVEGYRLNNNIKDVSITVAFYHQPEVR